MKKGNHTPSNEMLMPMFYHHFTDMSTVPTLPGQSWFWPKCPTVLPVGTVSRQGTYILSCMCAVLVFARHCWSLDLSINFLLQKRQPLCIESKFFFNTADRALWAVYFWECRFPNLIPQKEQSEKYNLSLWGRVTTRLGYGLFFDTMANVSFF